MPRRIVALALATAVATTALIVSAPAPSRGAANAPTDYVTMFDGTRIALNIQFPSAQPPPGGWPTIIEIDGYGGASDPIDPRSPVWGSGHYATVHMSLRGTGCSGGRFDLFDRRSAQDGHDVIEWIARQNWSNGRVAIWGHSYSGLTGWLVASTQPPHLVAMSVSGLIDDLYKGIVFMGGVSNLGFPLLWTGLYRPFSEYTSGVLPGIASGDATCAANQAGRVPPDVTDNPILNGLASLSEENQWWASHSLITYLDGINVPTHIVQTYQDEQTGPRGSNLLWQRLDQRKPNLPKRLLLTNGVHSTNVDPPEVHLDRIAWLDCYVRGLCSADILSSRSRVKVLWEMHDNGSGRLLSNGVTADPSWPLSVTRWTRYYLGSGGTLSLLRPPRTGSPDVYVSGSKRAGAWSYLGTEIGPDTSNTGSPLTTANLPDELRYQTAPFLTATAIAGPIDMTLWAASSAPDTEFYVELNDVDSQGNITRLQRGMLKASHRAIDKYQTDYDAAGDIIRPYHPDTNTLTALVVPGQVYQYDIEVFPLGFIFRPGHSLLLRVTTPPANDALATYIPTTAAGVDLVYHDASHGMSSILLPLIPAADVVVGPPLGCGKQIGLERCSRAVN